MSKLLVFVLFVILPITFSVKLKVPTDICKSTCVQKLYKDYCGGAECIHGVKTEEQKDAMCSDKCFGALFGDPLIECLTGHLSRGADTQDFQDFIMEEIMDFCFPEDAEASDMAEEMMEKDLEDIDYDQ